MTRRPIGIGRRRPPISGPPGRQPPGVEGRPGSAFCVRGLVVRVGAARLLDGVDLDVAAGEWLTVVGPNGAGKTTLLRALAGLQRPAAGTALLDGEPVHLLARRARARAVAYVPQDPVLPPGMRVSDYVLLGRTPHLAPLGAEGSHDVDVAASSLERLDVGDLAHRTLETLSGGERRRVLLARAVTQEAAVLLLDEPTTALDLGHQVEVLELVDQLRRAHQLTVVSTMHDLSLAAQFADRLALVDRGRVVAVGPASEVLTDEHLGRYYGTAVRTVDAGGVRVVVPLRFTTRLAAADAAANAAAATPAPAPSASTPTAPAPEGDAPR
jgi:iron complex transport system ATP-binding protein